MGFMMLLMVISFTFYVPTTSHASSFPSIEQFTDEEQLIIVSSSHRSNHQATLYTYEKRNGRWVEAHRPMAAVLGPNGMNLDKREGDGTTPMGVYSIGYGFGTAVKPSSSTFPYKRAGQHDYWVDDVTSPDYNKWISFSGNPSSRWKSFERMNHPLYKYGTTINYNTDPIVAGKGSAIFLHVWRGSTSPTAGCVAVSETNMVTLLNWLKQDKSPHIVIGVDNNINNLITTHLEDKAQSHVIDAQLAARNLQPFYTLAQPNDALTTPKFLNEYHGVQRHIADATKRIDSLHPSSKKQWLQQQLEHADTLRLRAARVIDVSKTGQDLEKAVQSLKPFIDLDRLDEEAVAAYHFLSSEIRRTERAVGRIVGSENRRLASEQFVLPAKIQRESLIWEVTIYEELRKLESRVNANPTGDFDATFELIERLKNRSIRIKVAGEALHPGQYPVLPKINQSLLDWEQSLLERISH